MNEYWRGGFGRGGEPVAEAQVQVGLEANFSLQL